MANFKRGKPKNSRSGCLMCKSHKMNGWGNRDCCSTGNGRKVFAAKKTLERYFKGQEE